MRTVLAAVAVVIAAGFAIPGQVGAQPSAPPGNGNAAVAGSECERALQTIAASDTVEVASNQEAYFTCSSGSIVIDVKDTTTKTSDQVILGNTETLQTRSITGLEPAQLDRADTELGLDDSGMQSRAGVPSNTCMVGPAPTTYVNSDWLAHGNVDICYGRFIVRGGVPVEIVWSDMLTYIMRQNLFGTRTIQEFSLTNISTNQAYEIGAEVQWNQRESQFGSDPWISGPDTVEMLPFDVGHLQSTEYYPSHSEGTYHLTNDYTTIHILEGPSLGAVLQSHPNLRMPDFECPALGSEPYQCSF
ncbi:hypothetical protein [Williamsia sp. D3]|uniref:hypothetical protein n=1 Tax=Williamsia sp. D3 TaxID=1313067 RepID=UPI001269560D|nr:hypothetical protein [Williamsia sp. D3]